MKRKLLLLFIGLFAGLVLVEVGLRLLGISYPAFTEYDAVRGMVLRPGASGWYREEGEAFVQYNSKGFRDVEHSVNKPTDTFRIALLGDSYVEADQVPFEDTLGVRLESELQSRPEFQRQKVEALNFGVSGYGTAQELLTLRNCVWQYQPDLVLLAITPANDVRNNSRALEPGKVRPFFLLQDGKLVLDNSFRNSRIYRIGQTWWWHAVRSASDHLRVIQLAVRLLKYRVNQNQAKEQKPSSEEAGLSEDVYRAPVDKEWGNAWDVTEALIALMNAEVKNHHARFLVVTVSDPIQVNPDRSVREAFMRRIGVPDLFYPDRRIHDLGSREGFVVLTLAPPFQAYADEKRVALHGFPNTKMGTGHWNRDGHALAAKIISAEICQMMNQSNSDNP